MTRLNDLNIALKIRRMILFTTGLALLLTSLSYLTIEFISYRQTLLERAEVLADFIATNSAAALTFGDKKTASRLLSSLNSDPSVNSATLFLADGSEFARYNRHNISQDRTWLTRVSQLKQTQHRLENNGIDVFKPVFLDISVISIFIPPWNFYSTVSSTI